jgi:hypothetical protein
MIAEILIVTDVSGQTDAACVEMLANADVRAEPGLSPGAGGSPPWRALGGGVCGGALGTTVVVHISVGIEFNAPVL